MVEYTSSTPFPSRQVVNVDNEDTIEEDFSPPSQPKRKRRSNRGIKKKALKQNAKQLVEHRKLIAIAMLDENLEDVYKATLKIEIIYIVNDIFKGYPNLFENVAYRDNTQQRMLINYTFNGVNASKPAQLLIEAKNNQDNATHAEHYCIENEQAYLTTIKHEVCRKVTLYALKKGEELLGSKKSALSVFNSDVDNLQKKANFLNGLIPPEELKHRKDRTFLSSRNKVLYTKVVNDKYPDFKKLILSILASTERELPCKIYGNNPMEYFMKDGENGENSLLNQIVEEISKELCCSSDEMAKKKQWAYVVNALKNKAIIEKQYNCNLRKPREPLQQVPETENDSAQPEAASAGIEDWTEIERQIYSTIYHLFYVPLKEYLKRHASTRTVEVFLRGIIEKKYKERRHQTLANDFCDVMRYLFACTDETFKQHFTYYETTEYICEHKLNNKKSVPEPCSTIHFPFDFPSVTAAIEFLVQRSFDGNNCFCGQSGQFQCKFYELPNEMQYLIIDGREHPPDKSNLSLLFKYNWSLCCKVTSSSATLIPQNQVNFPRKNMPVERSMLLIYKKE